jgi:hypothetical protein
MRAEATGVNDAFGDALVVEVKELFAKVKVLEGGGAARTNAEGVLIV